VESPNGAYQNAGGSPVGSNDAQPGDLIQKINEAQKNQDYPTTKGLHTAIVVARTSTSGTYVVRDSNWNLDEKVSEHQWSPGSWAAGQRAGAYVWRFGTVNTLDQYVGNIVKWRNADGSTVSWLVYADRTRRWIPDTATYGCLTGHGAADKGALGADVLNQLPDRSGSWASCSAPASPTTSGLVSSGQGFDRGTTVASRTGFYAAVQQGDGNFVLYRSGGRPQWANGANGPTAWTIMQSDGNLVSYDVIGRPR